MVPEQQVPWRTNVLENQSYAGTPNAPRFELHETYTNGGGGGALPMLLTRQMPPGVYLFSSRESSHASDNKLHKLNLNYLNSA